jgi:tRNA (guanosine-2'-O-)-methyltransferase
MPESHLTERRLARIRQALDNRTRCITVLLEDIYDPLNASAVLRTADGLGIQDVHIAENRHAFSVHAKVSGRAAHWLSIFRHRLDFKSEQVDIHERPSGVPASTKLAYETIRAQGYKIIATSPRGQSTPLSEINLREKNVIALGSEKWGLSDWAIENADTTVALPMLGFTESYNISVTAAMVLHFLSQRLRSERSDWGLEKKEKEELWQKWTTHKAIQRRAGQKKGRSATPVVEPE